MVTRLGPHGSHTVTLAFFLVLMVVAGGSDGGVSMSRTPYLVSQAFGFLDRGPPRTRFEVICYLSHYGDELLINTDIQAWNKSKKVSTNGMDALKITEN